MTDAPDQVEAPPAGEEIHLPSGSVIPLINAVGVAIAFVGLSLGLFFIITGLVIFLVTLVIWIRDTRNEIAELPADHSSH